MLRHSAPVVAVMDADLQHDETILPRMYERMRSGEVDLVVGSHYVDSGSADAGFSLARRSAAGAGARKARAEPELNDLMRRVLPWFRRELVEASRTSRRFGFKILADIIASAGHPLRSEEIGFKFRERYRRRVQARRQRSARFHRAHSTRPPTASSRSASSPRWSACRACSLHLLTLRVAVALFEGSFFTAQTIATIVAMTTNFFINNAVTYRDASLGLIPVLRGLLLFYLVCATARSPMSASRPGCSTITIPGSSPH